MRNADAPEEILIATEPARYRAAMAKQGFKWAADRAAAERGVVDVSPAPALQSAQAASVTCVQGSAGQFPCRNVDFLAQIPLNSFSSQPSSAANLWGFVDLNTGREYAFMGLQNGVAVVDVTNPEAPEQVASASGSATTWRDMKVYQIYDSTARRWRNCRNGRRSAPEIRC